MDWQKFAAGYTLKLLPDLQKMATVENCSLADRMDRVYEKDN